MKTSPLRAYRVSGLTRLSVPLNLSRRKPLVPSADGGSEPRPGAAGTPRRARPQVLTRRADVRRRPAGAGRVARPPERRVHGHAADAGDSNRDPDRLRGY